jgi:chromosome partitioning protein
MAIVISIANQKGGVGKTASAVNIAWALHECGKRVLVIDSDPQSSLSIALGIDPHHLRALEASGKTFYFGLVKSEPLESLVIQGTPSVIPASIRLASAETELVSPFGTATILREKMAVLREIFDVILIDCPPTLSLLTVNALSASGAVIIPVKTDYLSMMGIPLLLQTIENVRRRANPDLRIIGIIPTMFHARASHDAEALAELCASVAEARIEVFEPVNRSTAFDKANLQSRAALEMFPGVPGIGTYKVVATRILNYEN